MVIAAQNDSLVLGQHLLTQSSDLLVAQRTDHKIDHTILQLFDEVSPITFGDEELHVRVEVRPALTLENWFATYFGLAQDGKVSTKTGLPNLFQLAVMMRASASGSAPSAVVVARASGLP